MNEKIVNGYLIEKKDYKSFDKILKFLILENKVITCLALGINKITSKNSRNLFEGNLLEIQYFEARNHNKISKLKKITLIENLKIIEKNFFSLKILNFLFSKIDFFEFVSLPKIYSSFLKIINSNLYNDIFISNYILIKSQFLFGFEAIYSGCAVCNTNKKISSLSINCMGYLCKTCARKKKENFCSKESILLFFHLNNNQLNEAFKYDIASSLVYEFLRKIYLNSAGIIIEKYE